MQQLFFRDRFGASFFENNVDLYEYIRKREKEYNWEHLNRYKNRREDWAGNVTYEEAMNNLLYGNKDITPQFVEGLKNLGHDIEMNTGVFMNIEGFAYDMGAVVSGEPECCVDMKAPELKKNIKIVLDWTAPCGVKGDIIINRGIAIVNLIYTLMTKGYIVDFHLCRVSDLRFTGYINGEPVDEHFISIKVPTETLTIGTLGFYCSLEFFRIIMILSESMMLNSPYNAGELSGIENREDYMLDENVLFIPSFYQDSSAGNRCRTPEGAKEYIIGLFNDYCKEHNLEEI